MRRRSYKEQARASVDRMKAEREGVAEPVDSPAEDAAETKAAPPAASAPFDKKKPRK